MSKKKVKKVFIKLEDGRTYSILAHAVAHDRATYYAEKDTDTTYQDEYDYVMSDDGDDELFDWLWNNMNWYEHDPVLEATDEPDDLSDVEVSSSYLKLV